jgi:hypothetical protein
MNTLHAEPILFGCTMGDDADGIKALLRQYARRVEYLVLQNTACGVIWRICIGML